MITAPDRFLLLNGCMQSLSVTVYYYIQFLSYFIPFWGYTGLTLLKACCLREKTTSAHRVSAYQMLSEIAIIACWEISAKVNWDWTLFLIRSSKQGDGKNQ